MIFIFKILSQYLKTKTYSAKLFLKDEPSKVSYTEIKRMLLFYFMDFMSASSVCFPTVTFNRSTFSFFFHINDMFDRLRNFFLRSDNHKAKIPRSTIIFISLLIYTFCCYSINVTHSSSYDDEIAIL